MSAPQPVFDGAANPLWDAWRQAPPAPAGARCDQCAWMVLAGPGPRVLRCNRHRGARVLGEWPACPAFTPEVQCEDCGACCRQAFHVVEVGARDPFRVLHNGLLESEDGRWVLKRNAAGRCPCLMGDGEAQAFSCDRYEARPRTCRDFTLGSQNCCEARRRVGRTP